MTGKAFRFAGIKLLNVGLNIGLNLLFLLACPALMRAAPGTVSWFYEPLGGASLGIGWIFVANIISSIVVLLCLLPELTTPSAARCCAVCSATAGRCSSWAWPES